MRDPTRLGGWRAVAVNPSTPSFSGPGPEPWLLLRLEASVVVIADLAARFLAGGVLVGLFALLGDMFSPKSFAGLFAAAPSVALATMIITLRKQGADYVTVEARSMAWAAVGFALYAWWVSWFLHRRRARPSLVAVASLPVWAAFAFVSWALFLRGP
jgi:hypothetical protein